MNEQIAEQLRAQLNTRIAELREEAAYRDAARRNYQQENA